MSKLYETLNSMTKPGDLSEYAQRVYEWNEVARKARGGKYTDMHLQWSFIREEFGELMDALRVGDRVEVVDAACDLFVVASYAHCLKKIGYVAGKSEIYSYNPSFAFTIGDLEQNVYGNMYDQEYVVKLIVALCYRLDINLSYNMEQVLSSNDSKYPYLEQIKKLHPDTTDDGALRKECIAIEGRSDGRYTGVIAKMVEDSTPDMSGPRIVFFDSNGKIMKPGTFVNPEIKV